MRSERPSLQSEKWEDADLSPVAGPTLEEEGDEGYLHPLHGDKGIEFLELWVAREDDSLEPHGSSSHETIRV